VGVISERFKWHRWVQNEVPMGGILAHS
jgi:hypothetical protein